MVNYLIIRLTDYVWNGKTKEHPSKGADVQLNFGARGCG